MFRTDCPTFHSKIRKIESINKEINLGQHDHRMNVLHSCVKEPKYHQNTEYEGMKYFIYNILF